MYEPAEDSFLLSETLQKLKIDKNYKILDMGAGSGIQSRALIENEVNPKNFTLVDIDEEAIAHLRKNFPKSKVLESDLFENIQGRYNLIIFNPPYLPKDAREPCDSRTATTGGKKGSEIINRFLEQAKNHLIRDGKILLVTSSLTKRINWLNWKKKILARKKLFFEELRVWELT